METKLHANSMHLLAEMQSPGMCAGPQDASKQELIGGLVRGLSERDEEGNGFIVVASLRVHGDGRGPGDEVPVRHSIEQSTGVVKETELRVATEEYIGEEQVAETVRGHGLGMGGREDAAETVAGETGEQDLGETPPRRAGGERVHALPPASSRWAGLFMKKPAIVVGPLVLGLWGNYFVPRSQYQRDVWLSASSWPSISEH
jgi:hypothetical protein